MHRHSEPAEQFRFPPPHRPGRQPLVQATESQRERRAFIPVTELPQQVRHAVRALQCVPDCPQTRRGGDPARGNPLQQNAFEFPAMPRTLLVDPA